jgi:DNA-binding transcriptional MerR regulator
MAGFVWIARYVNTLIAPSGNRVAEMDEKKLLKMKDLASATGVNPGTIRYYIQEGLLPPPVKTYKNMAYYNEDYIERIRTIKRLQKARFLPLEVIKTLIEDMDFTDDADHLKILKEIEKPSYGDGFENQSSEPMTRQELAHRTGLPAEDIDAMEAISLITADSDGRFDHECFRIAEIAAEMRQIGLTEDFDFQIKHLQIHMDMIEFMARKEIDLFTRRIADKNLSQDRINMLVRNAVNCVNKLLPIIHFRMIRRISEELE